MPFPKTIVVFFNIHCMFYLCSDHKKKKVSLSKLWFQAFFISCQLPKQVVIFSFQTGQQAQFLFSSSIHYSPQVRRNKILELFCPVLAPHTSSESGRAGRGGRLLPSSPNTTLSKTRFKCTGCTCHTDPENRNIKLLGAKRTAQWLQRLLSNPDT